MGEKGRVLSPVRADPGPLCELQKGPSSQGGCSLAAGEVWLLRGRLFCGDVSGTKGVGVIHRTEQLQNKIGVSVEKES